jgi:hypothetical protein
MRNTDYKDNFIAFINEIKKQKNIFSSGCDQWKIPGDPLPLNGVEIGYEITNKHDRELLHEIGQSYGLIPLCPQDVIDIDLTMSNTGDTKVSGTYVNSFVGKLYMKKMKLNS